MKILEKESRLQTACLRAKSYSGRIVSSSHILQTTIRVVNGKNVHKTAKSREESQRLQTVDHCSCIFVKDGRRSLAACRVWRNGV